MRGVLRLNLRYSELNWPLVGGSKDPSPNLTLQKSTKNHQPKSTNTFSKNWEEATVQN